MSKAQRWTEPGRGGHREQCGNGGRRGGLVNQGSLDGTARDPRELMLCPVPGLARLPTRWPWAPRLGWGWSLLPTLSDPISGGTRCPPAWVGSPECTALLPP